MAAVPFSELDETTRLAMRLCAARSDQGVDSEAFSALVEALVESARLDGYLVGRVVSYEELPPREAAVSTRETVSREEPRPKVPERVVPIAVRTRGGRLTDEARQQMLERYAELIAGKDRAPRGTVAKLAAEYGVAENYLCKIGREYVRAWARIRGEGAGDTELSVAGGDGGLSPNRVRSLDGGDSGEEGNDREDG